MGCREEYKEDLLIRCPFLVGMVRSLLGNDALSESDDLQILMVFRSDKDNNLYLYYPSANGQSAALW